VRRALRAARKNLHESFADGQVRVRLRSATVPSARATRDAATLKRATLAFKTKSAAAGGVPLASRQGRDAADEDVGDELCVCGDHLRALRVARVEAPREGARGVWTGAAVGEQEEDRA